MVVKLTYGAGAGIGQLLPRAQLCELNPNSVLVRWPVWDWAQSIRIARTSHGDCPRGYPCGRAVTRGEEWISRLEPQLGSSALAYSSR